MATPTMTESGCRYARPKVDPATDETNAKRNAAKDTPASPSTLRETKIAMVIAMLERKEGATLDEMTEATGWLPHTARAAMTGLRKKGHVIERGKRGETSCYRIVASGDA